jgi:hypothetical protein
MEVIFNVQVFSEIVVMTFCYNTTACRPICDRTTVQCINCVSFVFQMSLSLSVVTFPYQSVCLFVSFTKFLNKILRNSAFKGYVRNWWLHLT